MSKDRLTLHNIKEADRVWNERGNNRYNKSKEYQLEYSDLISKSRLLLHLKGKSIQIGSKEWHDLDEFKGYDITDERNRSSMVFYSQFPHTNYKMLEQYNCVVDSTEDCIVEEDDYIYMDLLIYFISLRSTQEVEKTLEKEYQASKKPEQFIKKLKNIVKAKEDPFLTQLQRIEIKTWIDNPPIHIYTFDEMINDDRIESYVSCKEIEKFFLIEFSQKNKNNNPILIKDQIYDFLHANFCCFSPQQPVKKISANCRAADLYRIISNFYYNIENKGKIFDRKQRNRYAKLLYENFDAFDNYSSIENISSNMPKYRRG